MVEKHGAAGQKPFYVQEFKNGNGAANFFSLGITAGKVTAYRILNKERGILGTYGD